MVSHQRESYLLVECEYINPIDDKSTEHQLDGAMLLKIVEDRAVFQWLGSRKDVGRHIPQGAKLKRLDRREFVALPAFVDTHFHWVQDQVRLMPKDSLMTWLAQYTWPYEQKFADPHFAAKRAKRFARELLQVGTLGGLVYGSVHEHTVDLALEHFVGDFVVGNVLMTMNSPVELTRTRTQTKREIRAKARALKERYALTPRFAPTTHPDVMELAGELSARYGSMIQTHLSENVDEIQFVLEVFRKFKGFERVKTYTEIYDRVGLLGPKTVMGHGIHLSPAEWRLLAKRKTALAHCPSSNAPVKEGGLGSGLFDYHQADRAGVAWALASDIGGGPYLSMFDVMHSFVHQHRRAKKNDATYTMALYRSTRAGARLMGRHDRGGLDPQMEGSFLLVKKPQSCGRRATAESVLKHIGQSFAGKRERSDHLVDEVYYSGRRVFKRRA